MITEQVSASSPSTAARVPRISVCIVASRPILLDRCLVGLQRQIDAPDFEILVSFDHHRQVAAVTLRRFPDAYTGQVKDVLPAAARNALVDRARGELLLFLDDDAIPPPGFLRHIADLASANPCADAFGGPNLTPPGSSLFQEVQGEVLASWFVTGPVRHRYASRSPRAANQRHFMTCNLVIRRDAMRPFHGTLVCAEENGVLAEMSRAGHSMRYDAELFVYHERRSDYPAFAKQMLNYGRGRGHLFTHQPSSLLPAALIPATLSLYLLALPALLLLNAWSVAPLGAYLALVALASTGIGWSLRRPAAALVSWPLILSLHLGYGLGFWIGMFEGLGPASARSALLERD